MGIGGEITLTGLLVCATPAEAARVAAALPAHIALTRAEPGCLFFDVTAEGDGMAWRVAERFTDQAAFEVHQVRTANSDWARQTEGIVRDYDISGLA